MTKAMRRELRGICNRIENSYQCLYEICREQTLKYDMMKESDQLDRIGQALKAENDLLTDAVNLICAAMQRIEDITQ